MLSESSSLNPIETREVRRTMERPRSRSNPRIYYRNKQNNVIPYIENTTPSTEPIKIMISGEYINEAQTSPGAKHPLKLVVEGYASQKPSDQFIEYYKKQQSIIKDWDEEYLNEPPKKKHTSTKETESMLEYLYRIFISDTQNNKKEAEKEKYKETIEHLEVRTPSWPLFVDKEDFNKDVLNQQKITIEKKMLDDLEHYTVFKWSPISLRKTTTPMSEKSAENSPPITTYFTKKSKISP